MVLSCCNSGEDILEHSRRDFLRYLIPHEAFLVAKQTNIEYVKDLRYHYQLYLKDERFIQNSISIHLVTKIFDSSVSVRFH